MLSYVEMMHEYFNYVPTLGCGKTDLCAEDLMKNKK